MARARQGRRVRARINAAAGTGNRARRNFNRRTPTPPQAVAPTAVGGNAGGGKKSSDNSKNRGSRTAAATAAPAPAVRPSEARVARGQLIRQIAARSGGTGRTPINLARNARRSQRAT